MRERPGWRSSLAAVIAVIFLALLQGSGYTRFSGARLGPDLVMVLVVAWAFLHGASSGFVLGWLGGLLLDAMSVGPMGLNAMTLGGTGAAMGLLRIGDFSNERRWVILAAAGGTSVYYLVTLLARALVGLGIPAASSLLQTLPLVLVVDIMLATVLVWLMRRRSRRGSSVYEV